MSRGGGACRAGQPAGGAAGRARQLGAGRKTSPKSVSVGTGLFRQALHSKCKNKPKKCLSRNRPFQAACKVVPDLKWVVAGRAAAGSWRLRREAGGRGQKKQQSSNCCFFCPLARVGTTGEGLGQGSRHSGVGGHIYFPRASSGEIIRFSNLIISLASPRARGSRQGARQLGAGRGARVVGES